MKMRSWSYPGPNGADDTFDLSEVLLDFYGSDGSKVELLQDVAAPDFNAADDIGIYYDFYSLLEEGWSFCLGPSRSSVVLQDVDLPSCSSVMLRGEVTPSVIIDCGLSTPDFAVVDDDISYPADEVEDVEADVLTGLFVSPNLSLSCDEEGADDDIVDLSQVPLDRPDECTMSELVLDPSFEAVEISLRSYWTSMVRMDPRRSFCSTSFLPTLTPLMTSGYITTCTPSWKKDGRSV